MNKINSNKMINNKEGININNGIKRINKNNNNNILINNVNKE